MTAGRTDIRDGTERPMPRAGLSIGEVAARSGVPAKTIRYYEEVGLIEPAPRTGNGYRIYDDVDLHVLPSCDPQRASAEVKAMTLHRIAEIDRKMAELAGMRATLTDLAESCHGNDRPDCPILDDLAEGDSGP
jgi:MerR family copper efflux transcriptional regulator